MTEAADDDRSATNRLLGRYGGLVVAGLGFAITRFFVAEAVTFSGSAAAVVATVVPLIVGLVLSVAGVALAVGAFDPEYVADVSRGCLLGTGAMTLVLILTVVGAGVGMFGETVGTQLLLANVLLGGAVGGLVNGHRKASLRGRRRAILRGANRARFINRLLRHEVLNAAAIIDGHADLLRGVDVDRNRSVGAIRRGAARIESTINGVGAIAEEPKEDSVRLTSAIRAIDVVDASELDPSDVDASDGDLSDVDASDGDLSDVDASDGDASNDTEPVDIDVQVDIAIDITDARDVEIRADDRLTIAFERLIDHAISVRGAEHVSIEAAVGRHAVTVAIVDDGTPFSERQRDVLERGAFPEYDDPTSGFDLQAVTLLVGDYGGRIDVENDAGKSDAETRISVRLPRASADVGEATVGIAFPSLRRAIAAGLVAGLVMGGMFWALNGVLPVIGSLYGVESVAVGWITHLFHSVVFGLLFVAGASTAALRDRIEGPLRAGAAGLAWGIVLWFGAAGLLMPLWLRAVGIPVPIPNLPEMGLLTHGVWGVTLGVGYVLLGGRFD